MYGSRPIRFPAHWCADFSKYRNLVPRAFPLKNGGLYPFFKGKALGTRLKIPGFSGRRYFNRLVPIPFFWNTAPPHSFRTHTIPPATQATKKVIHGWLKWTPIKVTVVILKSSLLFWLFFSWLCCTFVDIYGWSQRQTMWSRHWFLFPELFIN